MRILIVTLAIVLAGCRQPAIETSDDGGSPDASIPPDASGDAAPADAATCSSSSSSTVAQYVCGQWCGTRPLCGEAGQCSAACMDDVQALADIDRDALAACLDAAITDTSADCVAVAACWELEPLCR